MRSMNTYFGDIHTHTLLSDGRQEPVETIMKAKSHLDFYAFSDHAQLPDTGTWGPDVFHGWRSIVEPMNRRWPELQKLIKDNHEPGRFVTYLGYEWSSMQWGDHNVYYLKDDEPIRYARSLGELYSLLEGVETMIIPHHTAYPPLQRGCDWNSFDSARGPCTEVVSFHGCSESDGGPYAFGTNMGPRCSAGTAQRALELGKVVGFIGGTDDHTGYPGFYGRGLCAVQAEELTRQALWDAFWKRRTYAITGDRIGLKFALNDQPMGSVISVQGQKPRQLRIGIDAWDHLRTVEIIKNNQTVKSWSRFDQSEVKSASRYKVGVEWGYHAGKMWDFSIEIQDGSLLGHNFHFQPPGFDQLKIVDAKRRLDISSETSSKQVGSGDQSRPGVKQIDLDVNGRAETKLAILTGERLAMVCTLGELAAGSKASLPFGPYQGAFHLLRPIPEAQFLTQLEWEDSEPQGDRDYYYVRGFQKNGQAFWSSPIWTTSR